ncbi:MAG: serine/threonine protein kinase, partial [Myxococcota bacterium]|nr:serine/threonine protein kinase [Myxococcota bacterium]
TGPVAPRVLAASPSQLSGAILDGRYQIEGFLSQGATARVYLAKDLATERAVVVKLLSPEAAEKPGFRALVAREATVTRRVRHPNVVTVLDEGVTSGGLPYLVLEALPGEPLDKLLARKGRVKLDQALKIVREAAHALAAAHAAGVVHRDVKPGNLQVRRGPGSELAVKLLDFGMAKLHTDEANPDDASTVLGTIEYMAPEQIVVERVDARADIYALGVVLFRLITGHLPFETDAGPMVLRHQLFSPIPPPSWLDEGIDPQVEALILNATRKHPDNRYPTMSAFAEDLEAILAGSGRVATRPLSRAPDMYVPTSERGREALRVLSQKFGPYASVPPPS